LESDNDEVDYFDAFISKKFQTTALNWKIVSSLLSVAI
jgi:hypothetical protein